MVLKKDILGLGNYMEEHHPKQWRSLYDNWDRGINHYSHCDIEVIVKPQIRRIGSINNSEQR
jgi:spore germination protein